MKILLLILHMFSPFNVQLRFKFCAIVNQFCLNIELFILRVISFIKNQIILQCYLKFTTTISNVLF